MATTRRDTTGITVALVLGALVGLVIASPVLPKNLNLAVGGTNLGPVGSSLLLAALVVVIIPMGIFALYVFFAALE